jgi:capsid portal protein
VTFRDKKDKLESSLATLPLWLIREVDGYFRAQADKRRAAEAEREAERRRKEQAERERLEREQIEELQAQARSWRDAADIRAFVAAVQSRRPDLPNLNAWAQWAMEVADRIDPIGPLEGGSSMTSTT